MRIHPPSSHLGCPTFRPDLILPDITYNLSPSVSTTSSRVFPRRPCLPDLGTIWIFGTCRLLLLLLAFAITIGAAFNIDGSLTAHCSPVSFLARLEFFPFLRTPRSVTYHFPHGTRSGATKIDASQSAECKGTTIGATPVSDAKCLPSSGVPESRPNTFRATHCGLLFGLFSFSLSSIADTRHCFSRNFGYFFLRI